MFPEPLMTETGVTDICDIQHEYAYGHCAQFADALHGGMVSNWWSSIMGNILLMWLCKWTTTCSRSHITLMCMA